jgi:hypothetical protein
LVGALIAALAKPTHTVRQYFGGSLILAETIENFVGVEIQH